MATVSKNTDTEIHITFEDQEKINKFARHNARLQDIKEELDSRKTQIQNLEEAGDELLMVDDEDALIPYKIGEVFVHLTKDETSDKLDQAKEDIEAEIKGLEAKSDDYKQILSDLKVHLYAKFGNNINLEADDD